MMQASNCTTPAALGLPPNPTDWLGEVDSAKRMPCSTASRTEPPWDNTFKASSLEGLPNGQVEIIKGTSPFCGTGSAPRAFERAATPSMPSAVPRTNRLRDMVITNEANANPNSSDEAGNF